MHDIVDLEGRGVASMFVATEEFASGAEAQARSLGFPTVARVYTPHPVQDRTDAEIREYADKVFAQILNQITAV